MNIKHKGLLLALAFSVLALAALTGYKAFKMYAGVEVVFPITGYDPRDLLSGHYLTYRLDIKEDVCPGPNADPVFVCVVQRNREILSIGTVESADRRAENGCSAILRGRCRGGRFVAGVERYYVPEQHSSLLDRAVRGWGENARQTELVISVDRNGRAAVKELLIDNRPWREFVKSETARAR